MLYRKINVSMRNLDIWQYHYRKKKLKMQMFSQLWLLKKYIKLKHYNAVLTMYGAAICTIRVLTIFFIYQNWYLSAVFNNYI